MDAVGLFDVILVAVLAAVVPTILAGWAWFKAHAAESEAKWDDTFVTFVQGVAQGVVNDNKPQA